MKHVLAGLLFLLAAPVAGAVETTSASQPINEASAEAQSPTQSSARAYWVFFQDKGAHTLDDSTLLRLAGELPPETWARRAASGSILPTHHDLDLWEPYVQAVAGAGELRHRSRWLNAVSADLTEAAVARLRGLGFVKEIRPVAVGRAQGLGPAYAPDGTPLGVTLPLKAEPPRGEWPYGPSQGQLEEIGVLTLHAMGFTGNRVRMMILDTGFRKDHNAFASTRILDEWDFVFEDGDTQNEPEDWSSQHNHGTGCWAVAGGYDPGRIVGPAFGAAFVLAKTEDIGSETQAEEDNYVAALEWADLLGVRVTSASLSYTCFDDGFCYDYPLKDGDTAVITRAVDIAASRGILCVNGAGNYGYDGPYSLGTPADADSMLAVGAVDSLNVIAGFSSRGPSDDERTKPEVVARGVYTWWAGAGEPDAYGPASGTSLSTPLAAGAAVLLAEAHPEWGAMDIREALMATADRSSNPDNEYGWGRIDLPAALAWQPLAYPLPFDLVGPADGEVTPGAAPAFAWRSTEDPDSGNPLTYSIWIQEDLPAGQEWLVEAGPDTTLILPFALDPESDYIWEVRAEDEAGLVRVSRQTRSFTTPAAAGAPEVESLALGVVAGPNPFRDQVRFRIEGALAPASWRVFDPLGRRVTSGVLEGAKSQALWDGRDQSGRPVPAGVYYLEVQAGNQVARRTLVRLVEG